MTRHQIKASMQQQRALADKYLAESDKVDGNSPRMLQLYRLWSIHDANARSWEAMLNRL